MEDTTADSIPLINQAVIQSICELAPMAKSELLLSEIVEIFLASTTDLLHRLRDAAVSDDLRSLCLVVHQLKGSCLCMGADALVALCQRLEEATVAALTAEDLGQHVDLLDSTFDATKTTLQQRLSDGTFDGGAMRQFRFGAFAAFV